MVTLAKRKRTKSFAKFDAELDETVCDAYNNADLTLTMRLGFRQVNPTGGAATGTYHDYNDATEPARDIIRWTNGSWSRWKSNFLSSAQRYWHGKFWLVNNFPVLEFEDRGQSFRHNVYCRFRLRGSDAAPGTSHHHVIDVVRLARTESWFGSHSTLYDSRDTESVEKARDSANNPVMQRAHVHEIGHLLGMGHAAEGTAACPVSTDTNATACYGTSDFEMNSVMGSGMALRPEHAYPWRMAVASITGRGVVRKPADNHALEGLSNMIGNLTSSAPPDFISQDWKAKLTRHYPRTMEEVRLNSAITTRPVR